MQSVLLHRDDLKTLLQILDSTKPFMDSITVYQDTSSGIGAITEAEVLVDLHGLKGKFKVTIEGESSW